MTKNVTTKPPAWFWIVSVVALLWNLMGAMMYLGQAFITDDVKAALPADKLEFWKIPRYGRQQHLQLLSGLVF